MAFVGGSLVPVGGHNVLEPALLGLPVLFGPHMFNFTEAAEKLLIVRSAWQVVNAKALAEIINELLVAPKKCKIVGQYGNAVVEQSRGALKVCLELIAILLGADK